MTTRHEVTCIIPHLQGEARIHSIGGPSSDGGWTMLEDTAIAGLRSGAYTFWTQGGGVTAEVVAKERNGRWFLQTLADGVLADNLLHLQRCPAAYKPVG
jgi:Protein of unknown function (DUF3892)